MLFGKNNFSTADIMYWFILATIALIYGIAAGDGRAIILGIILNMAGIAMHYLKLHQGAIGGALRRVRGGDDTPCPPSNPYDAPKEVAETSAAEGEESGEGGEGDGPPPPPRAAPVMDREPSAGLVNPEL